MRRFCSESNTIVTHVNVTCRIHTWLVVFSRDLSYSHVTCRILTWLVVFSHDLSYCHVTCRILTWLVINNTLNWKAFPIDSLTFVFRQTFNMCTSNINKTPKTKLTNTISQYRMVRMPAKYKISNSEISYEVKQDYIFCLVIQIVNMNECNNCSNLQ